MVALGIRYLCGWAMASDVSDRLAAEWPPHPDRVFMALVAAHHEGNASPDERVALEWLERQGPPAVRADLSVGRRANVTSFVPVNDVSTPRIGKRDLTPKMIRSGVEVLPESRPRQPRQFPVAIPADPEVHLIWEGDERADEHRAALSSLCAKVTRVGHSASLVQMWVAESAPAPSLRPDDLGNTRLRVPRAGRLISLEASFKAGRRPALSPSRGYSHVAPRSQVLIPSSVFHHEIVVLRKVAGPPIGLRSTDLFTSALRRAVMSQAPEPLPEWVSGHRPDGRPTDLSHVAFLPLADIGHTHARGHLLGAAIVIPREAPSEQVSALMLALFGSREYVRIAKGGPLNITLAIEAREAPPLALIPETWCASPTLGSRRWTSATPVVLDRFPKREADAAAALALACRRVGLPQPAEVVCHAVSLLRGVPTAREFPAPTFGQTARRRWHTHATVTFNEPVLGPVLLGAGRYRGYGLFRPIRESRA
jgi:CRISPR-associated protein Csb2